MEEGCGLRGGRKNGEVGRNQAPSLLGETQGGWPRLLSTCLSFLPHPCLPEDVRLTLSLCFLYYTPFAGQLDLWMFRATPGTINPISGCSGNFSGAPMSAFGNRECPSLFLCFTPSHCAGEIGLGGVNPGCLLCP